MSDLLRLSNPVFRTLAICTGALTLKMVVITGMTIRKRFQTGTFANAEDAKRDGQIVGTNDDVERCRRNHLNDLESIPPFVLIGLMYTLTDPDEDVAIWHFRIFTASRLLHMIAYQAALPQPSRALTFLTGLGCTTSMAIQTIRNAL